MLVVLFAAAAVAAALHRGHLCSSQPRHTQCRLAAWGLTPWASANAIFRAPLAFCQMSGPNGGDSGSMNDAVGLTGVLAGAALKPEEPRLLRHRKTLQHQGGSSGVSCFPFIFRTERSGNGPTRRLESPAVCRAGRESEHSVTIGGSTELPKKNCPSLLFTFYVLFLLFF